MKKTIVDDMVIYSGEVGYVLLDNTNIEASQIQIGVIIEMDGKKICSPPFCKFASVGLRPNSDSTIYELSRFICDNLKKHNAFDLGDVNQYDYYMTKDIRGTHLGSTFNTDEKYVFSLITAPIMKYICDMIDIRIMKPNDLYIIKGFTLINDECNNCFRWKPTDSTWIEVDHPIAIVIGEEDDSNGNESE